ncbi:MAG: hypothetical protein JRI23_24080, partial [Deltaproteobacteria bacterium]|nr:hypothetical protein [Deltaproteobacteria bacterium]MBW2535076.1 hypothetical protein [Deltaproteobacteria bacterium]
AEAPPATPAPRTDFPPPSYAALHERTAKEGDGTWTPYPEGTPAGQTSLYRSIVHPHPFKGYVFTIVVAGDLTQLELGMVAGQDEPKNDDIPKDQRPAVVPKEHQADLVAIFNGGFMARHGKHGMMLDGVQFVPPREERCTVAFFRDGRLRIRTWEALAADVDSLRAYRQSSPCLIEQGELHPELPAEHRNRKWGGAEDGKRDVRRSAVCLDQTGKTLMYGYGDYILAAEFAKGLKAAGGHDCAQLDINWRYTRFFPVDHSTSPPTLGKTFVEKLEYNKTSYITKPYWKDFFYLKKR